MRGLRRALLAVGLVLLVVYGAAWATVDRYGASRAIVWLEADTGDSRQLHASLNVRDAVFTNHFKANRLMSLLRSGYLVFLGEGLPNHTHLVTRTTIGQYGHIARHLEGRIGMTSLTNGKVHGI